MCTRRVVVLFGRAEQRRVLDQSLGHTEVLLYTAVMHRKGSARLRAECYVHGVGSWSPGKLFEQFSGWRCVGCGHSISWTRMRGSGCLTRVLDAPKNVGRLAG